MIRGRNYPFAPASRPNPISRRDMTVVIVIVMHACESVRLREPGRDGLLLAFSSRWHPPIINFNDSGRQKLSTLS